MKKSIFAAFIFLTSVSMFYSQSYSAVKQDNFLKDFVSKNWTASDGLPGNTITDVMQDDTGYLYIGTYDGLVRFDGVEFVTYNKTYRDDYNFVSARSIMQDSRGVLWVGANDEGITAIFKDGSCRKFSTDEGLPNNSVRAIEEDNEGNIWVGTASGVVYITPGLEVVRPSGLEKFNEENILVCNIFCDTAGRIWIASPEENGLFVYTNRNFEIYNRISKIENPIVTYVTQDNSGALWFGVSPHYAVKVTGSSEIVYDIAPEGSNSTLVNTICQDSSSNIWFAMDRGVSVLHGGEFSFLNLDSELANEKVAKIMEDREGNIWLATDRNGLQRLSRSKFKTTTMNTSVNAICEDAGRNVIWIGADNGLYCVQNDEFIENILTEYCRNVRIRDVIMAPDGSVLVSAYEKLGYVRMDPEGKIFSITKDDGLTGNKIRVSMQAADGNVYVGTTNGLNIIKKDGTIGTITKESGVKNDYIMCLFEDHSGKVWCGTDGGGIFILENGVVSKVLTTDDGLVGNVVFKISRLNENEIWIFTGTGVSRFDEKSGAIANFNSKDGLGVDGIFQGLTDYTGKLWMTSNRGIFCVNMSDMERIASGEHCRVNARYFGQSDGLVSGGATSTSRSMKDSLGRIWFTLIDGFSVYDPLNVTANKTAPLIKIQEIMVDTEKQNLDDEKIVLPPETKRLSIKYTGLSFISSEHMKFRTKLEGFDQDYSEWSTLRTVSYTNLKPGTYKFTFQAENSDEVLSDISKELLIIKNPFIWELVWFWILIAIFVTGIAGIIILQRFRSMRRYQVKLENEVEARTHDLKLEKEKSENLLLNILPKEIADELTENKDETIARKYPVATVLFTDIVGFTKISDSMTAEGIVKMLNDIVSKFDERAKAEGIEKIKTIGDSYMAATGLTEQAENDGAEKMMVFAKGILNDVEEYNRMNGTNIQIRVGINTGNLVAGVIGKSKFIYDVWGDTVNVASRMESSGIPMRIHVTENTFAYTHDVVSYSDAVEIDVKGKGLMKTFYVEP